MSTKSVRITAFIEETTAKRFAEATRRIGISGTALLNRALPAELNYFADLPENSERGAAALRFVQWVADDAGDAPSKKRRFNITLDREKAERMDEICREKRVPRDLFLALFLNFLVYGADGICEAPLKKIGELLTNPRHEFEEKRKSGPAADETLYNLEDESFTIREAVSQENPYSALHIDDEAVKLWEKAMKREKFL